MDERKYACGCLTEFKDVTSFMEHVKMHAEANTRLTARMENKVLIVTPACTCERCRPIN